MFARRRALSAATLLLATLVAGIAGGDAQAASPPCVWNAYADFRLSPANANPSPDSCGNADVWSYRSTTTPHSPASYALQAGYATSVAGHPEAQVWCFSVNCDLPVVGVNTGPTFQSGTVTWHSGEMLVHPGVGRPVIVAWTSPISGNVAITGGVHSDDPYGGGGIDWAIDIGATPLAFGSYGFYGSQAFADGVGGGDLFSVPVTVGDTIYLIVGPNGDYYYDSTAVDLTITQLTPPPPVPELPTLVLAGVGVIVVAAVAIRRQK